MTTPDLPRAQSRRWQPLRGGLMNIFRYDYDEFHFERGHLLLRGNNGTGKSRVLALLLPFLFDGEANPARLEPDGDQAKRIEWNLLVNRHESRTGYTWLEFGRVDDDGLEHYITLGCGLHAVQGRTGATKWFFVTHQRIGRDLFLQTPTRQALSQEGLKQALGAEGQLFTTADAYRKAVDLALFQLGPERYGALVDLLVTLRRPQLSRELNEAGLSKALSDALPPLPPSVLTEVAEAFRSLEDDQARLRTFQSARDGAEAFLRQYQRYCRVAARRRAERVRLTHVDYESAQRQLRTQEAERDQATQSAVAADAAALRLGEALADTATRIDALKDSDAMRDAEALARAEALASERTRDSKAAAARLATSQQVFATAEASLSTAASAATRAYAALTRRLTLAATAAATIGVSAEHDAALATTGLPAPCDAATLQPAKRTLATLMQTRKEASTRVRGLNRALAGAEAAFQQKNALRTRAEAEVANQAENASTAHDKLTREGDALVLALRTWAGIVKELTLATLETLGGELGRWCEHGDGDNPLTAAVNHAADNARHVLSSRTADARQREREADLALQSQLAEQRHLADGRHDPPPTPHTRQPSARTQRPGAPLWQLCDFQPDLDPSARAGLEAALESAGLLDAWVTPDGTLLAPDEHDTTLVSAACPPARTPLSQLLRVDIDAGDPRAAAVASTTVKAILERIGARESEGEVWVDPRGRWQLGPLRGAWHKPAAQHIGAAAREAHRRLRLQELAAQIEEGQRDLAMIREQLAALARRSKALRAEIDGAPKDGAVRQAHAALAASRTLLHRLRAALIDAEREVRDARDATDAARRIRDDDARDLGLQPWVDKLQAHDDALADYRQAVNDIWPAVDQRDVAGQQLADATRRTNDARQRRDVDQEAATIAATIARAAEVTYRTLEQTRGAEAREIVALLATLRTQHTRLLGEHKQEETNRDTHRLEAAVATKSAEHAAHEMTQHDEHRAAAIAVLQRFVGLRLLAVACPDITDAPDPGVGDWAAKPAVELARRVEQALVDIGHDDAAWGRVQQAVMVEYEKLQQTLRSLDFTPAIVPEDDGIYIVRVPFGGQAQAVPDFLHTLNSEIRERQALLAVDERRILEEHIIGEIAAHLHELLHRGEQWVKRVNDVLESRATSTGMMLRFVWVPADDGPPELAAARTRLLRSAAVWSPREREEVGQFLHAQIGRMRVADEHATWQEHLERAFDYRGWLRMVVERKQDGAWKRLTKRTHGTGSGGEKAIALTLPQFAAAAAHYDSAHPLAPRLILLDEAFVGVDSDMRSKCMSFLDHFDLDFVMTSEREWGCYATLPGVAIYQLVNRPEIWAVGMTRWVWNGRQRVRTAVLGAEPRAPTPPANTPQLSLVGADLHPRAEDDERGRV